MPKKKKKAAKAAKPKAKKAAKSKGKKAAKPKAKKAAKPKAKKAAKAKGKKAAKSKGKKAAKPKAKKALKAKAKKPRVKKALKALLPAVEEKAELLSSETVFEGPLFRVLRDRLVEPGGNLATRDIVRHNGSVVILAIDSAKNKRDPWVVVERQYRHAANRFLWELPAGKLELGEDPLLGAQRELAEETGYRAKKWKPLVEYYASPGFLGESMKVFVAEGLIAGDTNPDDDEQIAFRLVRLSELVKLIEKGAILDGKTLSAVLLYARSLAGKGKK
ncbi:MAG: NUDIX hydrolase [Terracidiphilus sp.]|jgi:ADP-ribose pyrophosphatase